MSIHLTKKFFNTVASSILLIVLSSIGGTILMSLNSAMGSRFVGIILILFFAVTIIGGFLLALVFDVLIHENGRPEGVFTFSVMGLVTNSLSEAELYAKKISSNTDLPTPITILSESKEYVYGWAMPNDDNIYTTLKECNELVNTDK
jgi:ABC-type sugar transport system permease subunit